ncbi:MAG: hybrid sensor histidine kinase/response regulator [Desulfuromonas sp.]|nr:MAG: hybrid sensor histidine kinase/response regulator [Desulfuromonas sp.]
MLTSGTSRFAGEKILVADDEPSILELVDACLRSRGFSILTASDGHECLQLVEKEDPALVLLDYRMPVMDGLTALSEIRSRFPGTYVIIFTGKGSEEVAVSLMKAGAVDYLQKPFSPPVLREKIDTALQFRQVELENRRLIESEKQLCMEIEAWNQELERRVAEKTRDLEKAHAEFLQVEKLAALGHISAGLAHEIRNPLNSINLFAQLLKGMSSEQADHDAYLDSICVEVDRIDDILVQLLAASKRDRGQRTAVDVAAVLEDVLSQYDIQIQLQQVEVDTFVEDGIPTLSADAKEIEQLLSNLIGNALFEMPDGGTLTVSLSGGETLAIAIADTGAGIPEDLLSRVFDPFFTTKDSGTGFGLSVALRIVKGYGGRIWAENRTSSGACLHIELPYSS